MRYPVVLFDVGETLIGPRTSFASVYAEVLNESGWSFSAEELALALRSVSDEISERFPPGVDRYRQFPGGEDEYWSRFSLSTLTAALGRTPESTRAEQALENLRAHFASPAAWVVYPEVRETLDALRDAGARLGIVSNWDSKLESVLMMLGLETHFEFIGVSHIEGVEKPDPELFEIVLDRMDARPEETLHVGDRTDMDFVGAAAAGIDAVIVDRNPPHRIERPAPLTDAFIKIHDLRPMLDFALSGLPTATES